MQTVKLLILTPLFAIMGISEFSDGKVHFINSRAKELNRSAGSKVDVQILGQVWYLYVYGQCGICFENNQVGTGHLYNVASTSMQRHDVALTLVRRCIIVMCLLGRI